MALLIKRPLNVAESGIFVAMVTVFNFATNLFLGGIDLGAIAIGTAAPVLLIVSAFSVYWHRELKRIESLNLDSNQQNTTSVISPCSLTAFSICIFSASTFGPLAFEWATVDFDHSKRMLDVSLVSSAIVHTILALFAAAGYLCLRHTDNNDSNGSDMGSDAGSDTERSLLESKI